MSKNSFSGCLRQCLERGVTLMLLGVFVTFSVTFAGATAVPVILSPVPKIQFFDASGRPLAFGCVFSYQSGTTTPLATYTDSTGTVQNTNPVILDAGGFANGVTAGGMIWLAAGQAYTLKVVSAGGVHCASGTTQYTIDGVGGGVTLLTTVLSCTGTCTVNIGAQFQLFQITLTGNAVASPLSAVGITPPATVYFEMIQDSAGAHTWSWPSNSVGGCTIGPGSNQITMQAFVWDGALATATGPCVTGNGPAISTGNISVTGTVVASGNITAPAFVSSSLSVATAGVLRLAKGDTYCWENNAGSGNVCWSLDGSDNAVWPNTVIGNGLQANATFVLNGSTPQTGIQGSDVHLLSAGTVVASKPTLCTDSNGGATTVCTGFGPTFTPQAASTAGLPVSLTANAQGTVLSVAVTFPSAPGTYRADLRSGLWITAGPNACATEIIDVTNTKAYASGNSQNANGLGYIGITGAEITSATYAAGASVTFHLAAICNANSTATLDWALGSATFSPLEHSFLQVTPVLSN